MDLESIVGRYALKISSDLQEGRLRMMKKLPVGIDSFEKLRREGFYYIDKTGDVYKRQLVVRSGDKSRSATPKRAVGLLHLPLGDENRRLTLALEAPDKMRPNQPLTRCV